MYNIPLHSFLVSVKLIMVWEGELEVDEDITLSTLNLIARSHAQNYDKIQPCHTLGKYTLIVKEEHTDVFS